MLKFPDLHQKADNEFRKGNLSRGLKLLEEAAKKGCAHASYRLSSIYYAEGQQSKGQKFLQIAEKREHPQALFDMAVKAMLESDPRAFEEKVNASAAAKYPAAQMIQSKMSQYLHNTIDDIPSPEILSDSPSIKVYRKTITPLIIDIILLSLGNAVQPARVYNPMTGRDEVNQVRNNRSINFAQIPPFVPLFLIKEHLSAFAEVPSNQAEPPMLMKYQAKERFLPHYDFIEPSMIEEGKGQRVKTLLLYLNDDYEGGETYFNKLDLTVKGNAGDILIFDNVDTEGNPDHQTQHEGKEIIRGTKWLLSVWFRDKAT